MWGKQGLQGLLEDKKFKLAGAQVQCAHAHRFRMYTTYWCGRYRHSFSLLACAEVP